MQRRIAVLVLVISVVPGCDSIFPQPDWVVCPSPGRYVFDLASSTKCSLNTSDLEAIEVFTDADRTWSERRMADGLVETTRGMVTAFEPAACRLSARVGFARTLERVDDPSVEVTITYDFNLTERALTGVAQVQVVCDAGADCGSDFEGGQCTFTANLTGQVDCYGPDDCQLEPGGDARVPNEAESPQDGGLMPPDMTPDAAGPTTDMGPVPIESCPQPGRVTDEKGHTWVCIQGGEFEIGRTDGPENEGPTRLIRLQTYWMTQHEVTVGQYRACVEASPPCPSPDSSRQDFNYNRDTRDREDHPMNGVDVDMVLAYLSYVEGARLPSESEWEFAASSRGNSRPFVWGQKTFQCDRAAINGLDGIRCDSRDATSEVCQSGSIDVTEQGVCDMAGNVTEWTGDDYHGRYDCQASGLIEGCRGGSDEAIPADGRPWIDGLGRPLDRVVRGGAFNRVGVDQVSVHTRAPAPQSKSAADRGFRLVRKMPP
ncbi:MAG: SUMF1/EgtB/PvdO family nonheme iron enzyme [Myxococcota bacterium]|nr:SUMF1/EgtB/PvdO family nonheme iron enzyme [Myxococcota bacterium]